MSEFNDPRVFFAAERTLMAWTRTSLTLLAFGFMVERFGLFLLLLKANSTGFERGFSYWVGIFFMLLGVLSALLLVLQYRKVLVMLKPVEMPRDYAVNTGVFVNLAVAMLGLVFIIYLFTGAHT